jgi:ABC-2 type transport system permease protein
MKKIFNIYKTCVATAMARVLTYRLNFVLSMLITLCFNLFFPLTTMLIYRSGARFPGWTFYEVLLIQSIFTLSLGLACVLFSNVLWSTMQYIREGSFEVVLLRPLNPLFFLIASNFDTGSFGLLIGGGVMFGIAIAHTGFVSLAAVAQFLLLFTAGFAVMTGFQMIMAATSFKWVGNSRLPDILDSILSFGKYPMSIFPQTIKTLTSFIIPVGMIGFFPASALLGRLEPAVLISVIPCVLFMFLGIWLYQFMVRLYEGVGG